MMQLLAALIRSLGGLNKKFHAYEEHFAAFLLDNSYTSWSSGSTGKKRSLVRRELYQHHGWEKSFG
jgi:hypothetical protein